MDRGAWWATVHGVAKELDRNEVAEHAHAALMYIFDIDKIKISEALKNLLTWGRIFLIFLAFFVQSVFRISFIHCVTYYKEGWSFLSVCFVVF